MEAKDGRLHTHHPPASLSPVSSGEAGRKEWVGKRGGGRAVGMVVEDLGVHSFTDTGPHRVVHTLANVWVILGCYYAGPAVFVHTRHGEMD